MSRLADLVTDAGTTLRLARFVVLDDLGAWLIREPAYRWAERHDPEHTGWQTKAVSGLDCPFCVGYWISLGVIITNRVARRNTHLDQLWQVLKVSLTLNYVTAHVAARMGDTGGTDTEEDV